MKIQVVAKKEGFRRCGRKFGGTPLVFEVVKKVEDASSQITEAELKILQSEKMLVVVEVKEEKQDAKKDDGGGKK